MNELSQAVAELRAILHSESAGVHSRAELAALRTRLLGRKQGLLTALLARLREVPAEGRRAAGEELNGLKLEMEGRFDELEADLSARETAEREASATIDVTLPGRVPRRGSKHPVTLVREEIESIFVEMGYSVADGPEIESDWYNFEALNIPPDHPARDAQDTFFLEDGLLLRTHTSPVQIRTMEARRPPIRIIIPGRVFRRDSDLRHSPMFHQVEGLVVDRGINFGHFKGTIEHFLKRLFPGVTGVQFRPSYFPFTEPSAEVDMSCVFCSGSGRAAGAPGAGDRCKVCSGSGWIEIMGAGMVDPRVFRHVGIDSEEFTGFAFGLGIDRVAMLKFGIPDLRMLFENDTRFLAQF